MAASTPPRRRTAGTRTSANKPAAAPARKRELPDDDSWTYTGPLSGAVVVMPSLATLDLDMGQVEDLATAMSPDGSAHPLVQMAAIVRVLRGFVDSDSAEQLRRLKPREFAELMREWQRRAGLSLGEFAAS